jgi:aryl-alcohol dehydrogenase-like predicted oxidoreductase
MTLIDTADSYGPFTNELLVGRAIGGRSDVVLSTKAGLVGRSDGALLRNGRPEHIRAAADASLRRLHAQVIDLYTLHSLDPEVPATQTWEAMAELVRAGKVRALGVMSDDPALLEQLQQVFPITAVFTEFSLWAQNHWPVVQWCGDRGVGVLATSPLGRGYLTGTMTSSRRFAWTDLRSRLPQFSAESLAANRGTVELLRQVALRHRATPGQVALAWVLQQGDHIVALTGTKRPDHLEENARASELRLGRSSNPRSPAPTSPCGPGIRRTRVKLWLPARTR